jgi:hypothetical protein
MAENEPRPTRTQRFVWKPISKTIRITLENGSHTVSWISLGSGNGPEDKQISALKPKNGPHEVGSGLLETHSKGKEPAVHPSRNVLETLTEEESSSDDDDSEVVWHCEGSGSEERTDEAPIQGILPARATTEVVEASSPRLVVSVTPIEPQLVLSTVPADVTPHQTPELNQEELAVAVAVEEGTTSLMESLTMVLYDGVGEGSSSPLSCTPLNMVNPPVGSQGTEIIVEGIDALSQPSRWVAWHMNMFRKQIGVSIKGHKMECLALLRKIEEDRKPRVNHKGVRRTTRKGSRELRSLSSSVNYDGKQPSCC